MPRAPASSLAGLTVSIPPTAKLYLRPIALLHGAAAAAMMAAGQALPLAGGPLAFPAVELTIRADRTTHHAVALLAEIEPWARAQEDGIHEAVVRRLDGLSRLRSGVGEAPLLMGVVNATPDSFSDGRAHSEPQAAVDHAIALAEAGAAILDIGGESTRPGALPVDAATEIGRVEPVLEGLARRREGFPGLRLSIDTRRAAVMRRALARGVDIINDVSALQDDPESLAVAAGSTARVILVHKRGDPMTMNLAPEYDDVALDVFDDLEARVDACVAAGIDRGRLIVDPSIGFGKRSAQNLALLQSLSLFHGLGCPLLLGFSRKALIAGEQQRLTPRQRVPGSLAAAMHALGQGVQILRVHDVAETRQVVDIWTRISQAD